MTVALGVDTGGTFTDLILLDSATGVIQTAKVSSTPDDPAAAIKAGLAKLGQTVSVDQVVVGTTIATNSIIQRDGPEILFITNEGFEDVPLIGRLDKERLYDLHWQKPTPLVQRRNCFGVIGRVTSTGDEEVACSEESLELLQARFGAYSGRDVVVAICLLYSYLRPDHERRVRDAVLSVLPDAAVSVSHDVSPVWREYERASTTIADAFVKPGIERYVDRVGTQFQESLEVTQWNLLASNGGYVAADQVGRRPAQLLLSGLAGGVIGGRACATAAGYQSVFSLDMGGTSCDIGLVLGGEHQYSAEFDVSWGVPVTIPCVAVRTIGAGGGSVAWVDKGGLLHVGPRSAGARPGPVAYGQGGSEPTITDANLTLGRLDPDYFLGGEMHLDGAAAVDALERLGDGLNLSGEAAALAVVHTADENMANAIRLIAVDRGLDPREFALIAFGGAGSLHARAVAERLGMGTVVVPPHAGLCSAMGCMIADARVDRVKTHHARSEFVDFGLLTEAERSLTEAALTELRQTVEVDDPAITRSADLRYVGQNHELEVVLPDGPLDERRWPVLLERFEVEHERQYGFALRGTPIELVNLRATALRPSAPLELSAPQGSGRAVGSVVRPVWFEASGPVECAVYLRDDLDVGVILEGPLIVADRDSTTVAFPGDRLRVHETGALILDLGQRHD
jgi:N-methylhydantoinase A